MSTWPRWFYYIMLAIGLAFTLAGAAMAIVTGEAQGWIATLLFGACTAMAVTSLWPQLLLDGHLSGSDLLVRFPGPVELRASPKRGLYYLVTMLVFAVVLVWMLKMGSVQGGVQTIMLWLGAIALGAGVLLQGAMLVWRPTLTLSAEGLFQSLMWRRGMTLWSDVADIAIWREPISGTPMVVFNDRTGRGPAVGRFDSGLTGRNASLRDGFGMAHEDLALLLMHWQERAMGMAGTVSTGPTALTPQAGA
ncbi:hypothetical protein [Phreatobacter sp.]|uniref:hypothetical protein n=1 Tax=Phreatobacter sp. TaxID=1966341 RepID=UPI003F71040C